MDDKNNLDAIARLVKTMVDHPMVYVGLMTSAQLESVITQIVVASNNRVTTTKEDKTVQIFAPGEVIIMAAVYLRADVWSVRAREGMIVRE